MATDNHELGPLSMLDQMAGGVKFFDQPADRDLGVTFLPAGQGFGKRLVRRGLESRPSMPKAVDTSASLQTCIATRSTPRHEASSNAISVASSDAREPSIPTSTGRCADCGDDGISSWITATGQWA